MAITVETDLPDYSPAYNTMEYMVSSSSVGNTGFKFVFRVFVEGVVDYRQFEVLPEPSGNYGVLTLNQYVETFVFAGIYDKDSTDAFEYARRDTSSPSVRKYTIQSFEKWTVADVPTLDPDGLGPVTTSDKYVWEAAYDHHDWVDERNEATPFNDWLLNPTNGIAGQFLTNNKNNKVTINDNGWTWLLTDQENDVDFLEVVTYDSAGVLIQTVNINNLLFTGVTNARMLEVATSPHSLNEIVAGIVLGAQPIITSSVASYTVQCFQSGPNPISEILNFEIQEECDYPFVRVHFLNEYGGFDSFNFVHRNQDNASIKRHTFSFNPYRISGGNLSYSNQQAHGATQQTETQPKIKIRSGYLNDEENGWLKELLNSREIYVEFTNKSGHSDLKPVKEISGNWVDKKTRYDKLFNLEAELTMSWINHSQRR